MPRKRNQPERDRVAYELTENIPIGTYTMVQPADGGMASFSFMSKRFLDLLGLERSVVEKDPFRGFDTVHPEDYDKWISLNIACFQEKKPFYGEVRVLVAGQVRWVLAESIPRSLEDGSTIWEGALSDITAQKIAEQSIKEKEAALLRAMKNAEDQERLKSNLLAHISHEIRTPLMSLLGLTELLGQESLSDYQRDLVDKMRHSGDSLLTILNTVLDHSRLEAGALQLNLNQFSLQGLIRKLQMLHEWAAQSAGITLSVQVEIQEIDCLVGDEVRVQQILSNLVTNAIRYTAKGEVRLRCQIVRNLENTVRVRFDVIDTGVGIPSHQLAEIFQPFHQASNERRVQAGTGLGLSIAKTLTDLMHGEIGVRSKLAEGSHFWVELPFLQCDRNCQEIDNLQPSSPNLLALQSRQILLVDDSPTVLSVLGSLLIGSGASVIRKDNAVDAIDFLLAHPDAVDALIIDLQMPKIDGFQAIRMIRKDSRLANLPIVVLTAGLLNDEKSKALDVGANAVLFKPIYSDVLTENLLRVMNEQVVSEPLKARRPARAMKSTPLDPEDQCDFPVLAGVDQQLARQFSRDNPILFRKFLRIFIDENQALPAHLIDSIRRQDYKTVMRRLHNLKGASRYIGALIIFETTVRLESLLLPYAEKDYPLPSSSEVYPIIAEIHEALLSLSRAVASDISPTPLT